MHMIMDIQLLMLLFLATSAGALQQLTRSSFPAGFLFGAGSSAYQYEGGWREDGKGPNMWDNFTSQFPEKITDHSNGDVAEDFYHMYKNDVQMLKEIGIESFRISISWSRILPHGKISKGVNHLGIRYYNELINELVSNGIKPIVTIFHWDTPQALEDDYGGFLSGKIVNDFREYADLCFELFGDRVKHWITINEPTTFSIYGYAYGYNAPGRCSGYIGNCLAGDSATEPYIVVHNLLLSHASAFTLYHHKYKKLQGGIIGLTISCDWMVPYNETQANIKTALRAIDFSIGWILEPVIVGDYPKTMKELVEKRLPCFSNEETKMLKGSFDFIGLNYYTGFYAQDNPNDSHLKLLSYTTDSRATLTLDKDGVLIGDSTGSKYMCVYPKGLEALLNYMMEKYNNPLMIITENGMPYLRNLSQPIEEVLEDYKRIRYHSLHLHYLHKAIKNGANVSGYHVWSFMDDFEWSEGFSLTFGINFVDRNKNLTRIPKLSAMWYKNFLNASTNTLVDAL